MGTLRVHSRRSMSVSLVKMSVAGLGVYVSAYAMMCGGVVVKKRMENGRLEDNVENKQRSVDKYVQTKRSMVQMGD